MEGANKFIIFAVGVMITAVLVIVAITVYRHGKSVYDNGISALTESTAELGETGYTQYDGGIIDGTQAATLIKNNWQPDNQVAICICTKDGYNIMYDHDGAAFSGIGDLKGFPTVDAKKQTLADNIGSIKKCAAGNAAGIDTYDETTGYSSSNMSSKGYINPNASFKGSIQRDSNNNIRCITFVQK